jgi:hypothetical protein
MRTTDELGAGPLRSRQPATLWNPRGRNDERRPCIHLPVAAGQVKGQPQPEVNRNQQPEEFLLPDPRRYW